MGDVMSPKPMPTDQNRANDAFADILKGFLTGAAGGGGGLGALGPISVKGAGGVNVPFNFGGGGVPGMGDGGIGGGAPGTLGEYVMRFNLPEYGGQMSQGMTGIQQAAQGFGADALSSFFNGGWDQIQQSLTGALQGNAGYSLEDTYRALDAQRRQGLTRDLGQLEEEFGVSGLSDSTALHENAARRQTESEQNLMAEVARMAPSISTASTQNIGQIAQLLAGIPLGVAQAGFNLGEGGRQIEQQGLDRMYNEFLRQQTLFPQILQYLAGTPPVQYGPSPFSQLTNAGLTGLTAYNAITG